MCLSPTGSGVGGQIPEAEGGGCGQGVQEMEDVPQREICETP